MKIGNKVSTSFDFRSSLRPVSQLGPDDRGLGARIDSRGHRKKLEGRRRNPPTQSGPPRLLGPAKLDDSQKPERRLPDVVLMGAEE